MLTAGMIVDGMRQHTQDIAEGDVPVSPEPLAQAAMRIMGDKSADENVAFCAGVATVATILRKWHWEAEAIEGAMLELALGVDPTDEQASTRKLEEIMGGQSVYELRDGAKAATHSFPQETVASYLEGLMTAITVVHKERED